MKRIVEYTDIPTTITKRVFESTDDESIFMDNLEKNFLYEGYGKSNTVFCTSMDRNELVCNYDECINDSKTFNVYVPFEDNIFIKEGLNNDIWTMNSNLQSFSNKFINSNISRNTMFLENDNYNQLIYNNHLLSYINGDAQSWIDEVLSDVNMSTIITNKLLNTFDNENLKRSMLEFRRNMLSLGLKCLGMNRDNINISDILLYMDVEYQITKISDSVDFFSLRVPTFKDKDRNCYTHFLIYPIFLTGSMFKDPLYQTKIISHLINNPNIFSINEKDNTLQLNLKGEDIKYDVIYETFFIKSILDKVTNRRNPIFSTLYQIDFNINNNVNITLGNDTIQGVVFSIFYLGQSFSRDIRNTITIQDTRREKFRDVHLGSQGYDYTVLSNLVHEIENIKFKINREKNMTISRVLNYFNVKNYIDNDQIILIEDDPNKKSTAENIFFLLNLQQ